MTPSWMALALTAAALISDPAHAVDVNFQAIAPGVYAHVGETEGRTYDNEALNANIGLVVTQDGALLIDPGATFQSARQIAEAAKKVTPLPIKWVINTGGQDHRWLGNGYFKSQGAEIIAHADAEADMKARAQEHLSGLKSFLKEKLEGTEPTYPTRWLQGPENKLVLGGVTVEVKHRQGGHTPGDSLVWLPQNGVMLTGDVVYVDRTLGLLPVSRTKAWLESFDVIDQMQPKVIVPGHGKVTDLATARKDTRDLLLALRQQMGKAVEQGTDLNTAVKGFDAAPFKHLQHADVWLPQLANLTYLEMERE